MTPKGSVLPLVNLKGKDYLMTAYRLQWFVEENSLYHISTQFLVIDDEQTVAQVNIIILNEQGQAIKKAVGTKRETKKDFSDHTEKAETGALGRALIQLGYGTQYALADLDEGSRLADSPLVDTRTASKSIKLAEAPVQSSTETSTKVSSFRKTKPEVAAETPAAPKSNVEGEWL